jgi:hypothetical protein
VVWTGCQRRKADVRRRKSGESNLWMIFPRKKSPSSILFSLLGPLELWVLKPSQALIRWLLRYYWIGPSSGWLTITGHVRCPKPATSGASQDEGSRTQEMHFPLEFGTILSRGSLLTIIALWLPSHHRLSINGTAVRRVWGSVESWTASKNYTIVWRLTRYLRYQYLFLFFFITFFKRFIINSTTLSQRYTTQ